MENRDAVQKRIIVVPCVWPKGTSVPSETDVARAGQLIDVLRQRAGIYSVHWLLAAPEIECMALSLWLLGQMLPHTDWPNATPTLSSHRYLSSNHHPLAFSTEDLADIERRSGEARLSPDAWLMHNIREQSSRGAGDWLLEPPTYRGRVECQGYHAAVAVERCLLNKPGVRTAMVVAGVNILEPMIACLAGIALEEVAPLTDGRMAFLGFVSRGSDYECTGIAHL